MDEKEKERKRFDDEERRTEWIIDIQKNKEIDEKSTNG